MNSAARPHIVILGAGLGGSVAAFEIKDAVRDRADITVVNKGPAFQFVPSNPWVAVGWRKRGAVEVELAPVMKKRGIAFVDCGARQVRPGDNQVELADGRVLTYDYLVIATGPELAFDEIQGLGLIPALPSRFAILIMPRRRRRRSTRSRPIPARSLSGPCRGPHALGRPTSSPSSWIRS